MRSATVVVANWNKRISPVIPWYHFYANEGINLHKDATDVVSGLFERRFIARNVPIIIVFGVVCVARAIIWGDFGARFEK